jgi:hypothetical protein
MTGHNNIAFNGINLRPVKNCEVDAYLNMPYLFVYDHPMIFMSLFWWAVDTVLENLDQHILTDVVQGRTWCPNTSI